MRLHFQGASGSRLLQRQIRWNGSSYRSLCRSISRHSVAAGADDVHTQQALLPKAHLKHAEALSKALELEASAAAEILQRQPTLLSISPAQLITQLQDLCTSLDAPSKRIGAMASKHPELLLLPPNALRKRAANLAKQMRISEDSALQCVRKTPFILTQTMQQLKERLDETSSILHTDLPNLVHAARKQPVLFVMDSHTVQSHTQQLSTLLGISYPAASKLLLSCPNILTISFSSLQSKLHVLHHHWHLTPQAAARCIQSQPDILEHSASTIERNAQQLTAMTAALQLPPLSRHQLMHLATAEPALVSQPAQLTAQKLQRLHQLLQMPAAELLRLLMRRPALLCKSSDSISNSYRALSIWDFDAGYKQRLLQEHPLLLRLMADEVFGRCNWLRSLMLRSAYLHSTLRELPPKLLGVLILHLPAFWCRLDYVVESGQEPGIRLMEVLQCPHRFREAYPGYAKWAQWRTSECAGVPWREQEQQKRQQRKEQRKAAGAKGSRRGDRRAAGGSSSSSSSRAMGSKAQQEPVLAEEEEQQQQQRVSPVTTTVVSDAPVDPQHILVGQGRLQRPRWAPAPAAKVAVEVADRGDSSSSSSNQQDCNTDEPARSSIAAGNPAVSAEQHAEFHHQQQQQQQEEDPRVPDVIGSCSSTTGNHTRDDGSSSGPSSSSSSSSSDSSSPAAIQHLEYSLQAIASMQEQEQEQRKLEQLQRLDVPRPVLLQKPRRPSAQVLAGV